METREWLRGGGELGELLRTRDWAGTELRERGSWPQSLRTAVCLVTESRQAMALLWGPELLLLYNDAYRSIAADKHPGALGRPMREAWPEIWDVVGPICTAVMERGESLFFEDKRFTIRRDGRLEDAWFTVSYSPVREEDGTIGGTLVTLQETTSRVRAEEALRASEARYRLIVENAAEGIWTLDAQGRSTFSNRRMADMLGYTVDEMVGRPLFDFMAPSERAGASHLLERRKSGLAEHHPFAFQRKDGSELRAEVVASPILDAGGQVLGAMALVTDVSGRWRAEDERDRARLDAALQRGRMEAMVEADRRKNEFIAVLSHELRNPLAPLRASLYALERAPAGSDPARRALAVMGRQVDQMAHLVEDLLDVSRIARGRIELRLAPVDLGEVVRRVVEDHRAPFSERAVELEFVPSPVPLPMLGDETRLSQALGNLLGNALKFTPRGGRATVSVEADSTRSTATVRVADTGRGFSSEVLPRLFEPFSQDNHTLDRSLGGLGLGLVLVKGLVGLHGGMVSAASDGPGKGATFTLELPLRADVVMPGAAPSEASTGARRRVLVIEDNRDSAEALGDVLAIQGHEVALAHAGDEGLARARSFRPDVVICDIGLPGLDGYAVARALRADPALSHARLVAHSGYASDADVARARDAGFDAQLAKPADMEDIARVVSGVATHPVRGWA